MSATTISTVDIAAYRLHGWTTLARPLPSSLLQPIAQAAETLAARRPQQALLSGAHNPFGRAGALFDPWKFLDVCESTVLLDAVEALLGPDLVLWDSEVYLDAAAWDAARRHEGRYWPAEPLAGLTADVALASGECVLADVNGSGSHHKDAVRPERSPHSSLDFAALRSRRTDTESRPVPSPVEGGERVGRIFEIASSQPPVAPPGAHYVIRYMPATSHYNRDPRHAANRLAMEKRPLVNYQNRPLWLVRGVDRADNDFATGFALATPAWAADPTLQKMEV
ncbi:MAG: hypothetical protein HY527_19910 [Betaproteobacteria bacterium]|nr:hypothetical protein [Betaproteobacteria bacterium]